MEVEIDQHVMVPWEPLILLPIKLQLGLIHLFPYMLKKFDWENSSLDDFEAKLANYWACPKGWDEWINSMSYGIIWVVDP